MLDELDKGETLSSCCVAFLPSAVLQLLLLLLLLLLLQLLPPSLSPPLPPLPPLASFSFGGLGGSASACPRGGEGESAHTPCEPAGALLRAASRSAARCLR